ncbi:hypothetical protein [Paraburkholderia caribensis]|uniref:hypothetical protein n=1 Tax=Paraburkholderia caribensis TaxID=75105 RepID=UPI001CB4E245|nr:hypothetical protein [Paraburkholderia caribensis]CAG9256092.1 hypothetical protein PCAR4_40217 [Paraburkholderia caribensis]
MSNPILIGQAEEIDLVQPKVRAMLNNEGFYVGGDTKQDRMIVPLVSVGGRVFCMKIDTEMEPSRFLPSLTLHGPYGPQAPVALNEQLALAFIEQFEIVGDNNDSRGPSDEEKFVLREFVLQLFDQQTIDDLNREKAVGSGAAEG